jgi:hypothetical protein
VGGYGRLWGQGGEMTQALYARMNKTINKNLKVKKKKKQYSGFQPWSDRCQSFTIN